MLTATARKPRPIRLNRAERREARTREILEAAWALYCDKGYEAVTVEEVAEHAGISRMPIYKLFGDKQSLYFELARQFVSQLSATMIGTLKAGDPLRLNLARLARTATSAAETRATRKLQSLFQVVHVISAGRADIAVRHKAVARKVIKDCADMIRASTLEPGERLRTTPEGIAALIVGLLNGLSNVEFETGQRYTTASDLAAMFMCAAFR
jgi:AcrR family transcriptional regulator